MTFIRSLFCATVWALSSITMLAQPYGWSQFASSPANTTPRLDDVFFIDANTGWAVRSSNILKTINGGAIWMVKTNSVGTHFRCIGFASTMRGWAGNLGAGSYDTAATDTNVFYQTFDGGETWSVVPGFNGTGMKGFCALHVLDAQHIYGAGRVRGPAHFVRSTDGGANWSVISLTAAGVMNGIMDVYFQDALNGFVVGMDTNAYSGSCSPAYHGRIARTTDGGNTWTPVVTTSVSCCYFWKMSWPSPNVGYVSLQQNSSNNRIIYYKTTDGGGTWVSNSISTSVVGGAQFYLQGIGFVNENEGWIGGDSNTSPYANNFLQTMDGGATWTPAGYNNTIRINRIRFLNPLLGHASGAKLHVFRAPFAITVQPQDQTVVAGSNVALTVTTLGDALSYAWSKDGVIMDDATNAMLILTNISRAQSGRYSVRVGGGDQSRTTTNALVRVLVPQRLQRPLLVGGNLVRVIFSDLDGGALTTNDLAGFEVQASTNFTDWLTLTNALSYTNGQLQVDDARNRPHRFYRVLSR